MRNAAVVLSLALASSTLAGGAGGGDHLRFTQQHGFTFSEIGDPGNPAYVYDNIVPGKPPNRVGAVGYRYRIATTEVSVAQWGEFIVAYAPFIGAGYQDNGFHGAGFSFAGFNGDGIPQYAFNPSSVDSPQQMGWRYVARFCNWLHNGKPTGADVEQWVFETGAYDTSTFTRNPDGTYNDQRERSAGARFFIPTLDEWVKAVYWDPERNDGAPDEAPGEAGGWRPYAYGDTVPVPGAPDEGGQTNATLGNVGPYDVGSYPEWTTPWGLLDASGGETEWLENGSEGVLLSRLSKGTRLDMSPMSLERWEGIPWFGGASPEFGLEGFRLAALVPGPGAGVIILCVPGVLWPRSRR